MSPAIIAINWNEAAEALTFLKESFKFLKIA